jgi:hypothetical protein
MLVMSVLSWCSVVKTNKMKAIDESENDTNCNIITPGLSIFFKCTSTSLLTGGTFF